MSLLLWSATANAPQETTCAVRADKESGIDGARNADFSLESVAPFGLSL